MLPLKKHDSQKLVIKFFIINFNCSVALILHKIIPMKKLLLLSCCITAAFLSRAQFAKNATANEAFSTALSTVVLDYKNNFINVQSKELAGDAAVNTFVSAVCLPNAAHCYIVRYTSEEDKTASWQAQMYSGDSYNDAVRIYKNTFRDVKATTVPGIDKVPDAFSGKLQTPDESIRFTVSALRLNTSNPAYNNFEVSVELLSNPGGWEVNVNLYKKKPDTEGNLDN